MCMKIKNKNNFLCFEIYVSLVFVVILLMFCDIIVKGVSGKVLVFFIGFNLFMMF